MDSLGGEASGFLTWTPLPGDTLNSPYLAAFFASDHHCALAIDTSWITVVYNHPPQFDSCPSRKTVLVGDTVRFTISASDPNTADTLTLFMRSPFGEFPEEKKGIGTVKGDFTWAPDSADTQYTHYYADFLVTDHRQAQDTCIVEIEVRINHAPEIYLDSSLYDTTIYERETLEFTVLAEDPDGDSIILTAEPLPDNATFEDSGNGVGLFTFTPNFGQVDTYYVTFIASDTGGLADTEQCTITVKNETLNVVEHSPDTNEDDVLIDTVISITLSEPIEFETVDSSTFKVESKRDGILKCKYIDSVGVLGCSLTSQPMFSTLDTITVTLTTEVKDLAGYGMDQDYSWEFYTGLGVYPGNTNNDTTVDERDILPLGLYWGKKGPSRKEEYKNNSWSIKPVHRWTPDSSWNPPSAVYADADGSGSVDSLDICAVADNWECKIFDSPQELQKSVDFTKVDHQKYLSIYEKIYNALVNCPESRGKKQIKKFLEEILEKKNRPSKFEVSQNYPNPFNSITVIRYSLPQDCQVEIRLFNILGQKVKTLVNEYQSSGYKKVFWDGKDDQGEEVGSGIYFYQVKASSFSCTRKLLLLK